MERFDVIVTAPATPRYPVLEVLASVVNPVTSSVPPIAATLSIEIASAPIVEKTERPP